MNLSINHFDRICRTCLNRCNLTSITSLNLADKVMLKTFLLNAFQLKIESGDHLPQNVCALCLTVLRFCFDFRAQCHKYDGILRAVLEDNLRQSSKSKVGVIDEHFTDLNIAYEAIDEYLGGKHTTLSTALESEESLPNAIGSVESAPSRRLDLLAEDHHDDSGTSSWYNETGTANDFKLSYESSNDSNCYHNKLGSCIPFDTINSENSLLTQNNLPYSNVTKSIPKFSNSNVKGNETRKRNSKSAIKAHKCSNCSKRFVNLEELETHLQTHTEKAYKCLHCDRSYAKKYDLKLHAFTHSDAKPHECEQCNRSFSRKYSLRLHLLTHSGEKPFQCTECKRGFTRKHLLENHMVIHSDQRPYQCVECQRAFAQRSALQLHMIVHSGEKPYTCLQCGRAFTHKGALKAHMVTHNREKPHMCCTCNRTFVRKHSLKHHIKVHHSQLAANSQPQNTSVTTNNPLSEAKSDDVNIDQMLNQNCTYESISNNQLVGEQNYTTFATFDSLQTTNNSLFVQQKSNEAMQTPNNEQMNHISEEQMKTLTEIPSISHVLPDVESLYRFDDMPNADLSSFIEGMPATDANSLMDDMCLIDTISRLDGIPKSNIETYMDSNSSFKSFNVVENVLTPPVDTYNDTETICEIGVAKLDALSSSDLDNSMNEVPKTDVNFAYEIKSELNVKTETYDWPSTSLPVQLNLECNDQLHYAQNIIPKVATWPTFESASGADGNSWPGMDAYAVINARYGAAIKSETNPWSGIDDWAASCATMDNPGFIDADDKEIEPTEDGYKCNVCDKMFKQRVGLNAHMKMHIREKPHKCTQCDRSYASKFALCRHIITHSGVDSRHECAECCKTYAHKWNLLDHVRRVHIKEKRYKCLYCIETFVRKSELSRHIKCHIT